VVARSIEQRFHVHVLDGTTKRWRDVRVSQGDERVRGAAIRSISAPGGHRRASPEILRIEVAGGYRRTAAKDGFAGIL
jgi:hypothetical protein